jgi:hypothetical protein
MRVATRRYGSEIHKRRPRYANGVEINGSQEISFASPAAYIRLKVFKLTHASSISSPSGTKFISYDPEKKRRFIRQPQRRRRGDRPQRAAEQIHPWRDARHCRFRQSGRSPSLGAHNYFHDFTSPGGNGAETIRCGLSGLSLSTGMCEFGHNRQHLVKEPRRAPALKSGVHRTPRTNRRWKVAPPNAGAQNVEDTASMSRSSFGGRPRRWHCAFWTSIG